MVATTQAERMQTKLDTTIGLISKIVLARGDHPLSKWPACWQYKVDIQWQIAWNGHKEPKPVAFEGGMSGTGEPYMLRPISIYVEYNGWMAGEFDPVNLGWIAGGDGANVDTFHAAVEAALTREQEATDGEPE